MRLVIFFLIVLTDAVSKLGSGTNFKIATVKSRDKAPGTVYGAFPVSISNGYATVGIDNKGNILVTNTSTGSPISNAYAYVIYV